MSKIESLLEERLEDVNGDSTDDETQIGDQFSDFEILQILSKGEDNDIKQSYVAKVRSLKNDKIYAMRKFVLEKVRQDLIRDNCIDELDIITELNHPNIIKYYKYFTDEKKNIYLIMEYMNNGDVEDLIKVHKELSQPIKEEQIWNILLHCSSALKYLDINNYLHYGIKLNNIFFNDENKIKICIFNESPKVEKKIYDIKDDVYELGFFIYTLCVAFNCNFIKSIKEISYKEENMENYSRELTGLIYNKMRKEKKLRPDAIELYENVKKEYMEKYSNNTSINSVLRCLHSYPNLNKLFLDKEKDITNNKDNNLVSFYFLKALKSLSGTDEYFFHDCLLFFRTELSIENSRINRNIEENEEIDPLYFLLYLLEEIHKELNPKKKVIEDKENEKNKYVINLKFNEESEDKGNKMKVLNNFIKSQENQDSPIYHLFYGLIKTKIVCQVCKNSNYSFSNFSYVIFDISEKRNNEDFNLVNGFKKQSFSEKLIKPGEPDQIYCQTCLRYQVHYEFNQYFTLSNQLIICFYYGVDNKKNLNKINIDFPKDLDLSDCVEDKNSPKKYYLVGSINRNIENGKEKFVYFARDPEKKNWMYESKNNSTAIDGIKNEGQIVMLFYNKK